MIFIIDIYLKEIDFRFNKSKTTKLNLLDSLLQEILLIENGDIFPEIYLDEKIVC